jgi:hypothetical protein
MDGTVGHHVEQDKASLKTQISYAFTHMQDLDLKNNINA